MEDPLAECVSILLEVGWIRPACVAADDPPSELAEFFASQNLGRSSEHEHMEQSTRVLYIYQGIVHKMVSEKKMNVYIGGVNNWVKYINTEQQQSMVTLTLKLSFA